MNAQKKGARLGLRIFKTGLAATVSLLLCDLAHFEQPLVAVVAAVLSMERNMDDSLRGAMERLAGTVLGLLCGAILFRLSPHNAGLCGAGIIAVMYVCKLLKIPQGMVMSAFCMGVMLLHDPADGTFATAVNALLAAAVGIMLAVLINFILLPPNYAPTIFQNDRLVLKRLQAALEACESRLSPPDFLQVRQALQALENDIRLYTTEWKPLRNADGSVFAVAQRTARYREALADLEAADRLDRTLDEKTQVVFSYHITRAKDTLQALADEAANGPPDAAS